MCQGEERGGKVRGRGGEGRGGEGEREEGGGGRREMQILSTEINGPEIKINIIIPMKKDALCHTYHQSLI